MLYGPWPAPKRSCLFDQLLPCGSVKALECRGARRWEGRLERGGQGQRSGAAPSGLTFESKSSKDSWPRPKSGIFCNPPLLPHALVSPKPTNCSLEELPGSCVGMMTPAVTVVSATVAPGSAPTGVGAPEPFPDLEPFPPAHRIPNHSALSLSLSSPKRRRSMLFSTLLKTVKEITTGGDRAAQ